MLRAAREAAQAEERERERARAAIPPELRGTRHASIFFLENGRLPRIGDEVPPWRYCGWLLPYVQGLHSKNFPLLGDRWGYYQRTLAAGRLLDEPIPQARFEHPHTPTLRALEKWVSLIEVAGVAAWNSLVVFVDWLAWALDVGPEPTHPLGDELQEKLYRTVNLELWLENPSDYLGAVASERYGGGPLAFFPTPHSICTMMAQMVMADVNKQPDGRDPRLLTVNEPCCGTGRLLLVASNYSMCLSGQDIAPLMVAITKINLAVYAPWGLYGLPWLHNPALGLRLADALTDKAPSR